MKLFFQIAGFPLRLFILLVAVLFRSLGFLLAAALEPKSAGSLWDDFWDPEILPLLLGR